MCLGANQANRGAPLLEPFDPAKHKPRDVGEGGPSTELSVTEKSPDGAWWNVPSLWWDERGEPHKLEVQDAVKRAAEYEKRTGKKFPRFGDVDTAVEAAKARSAGGGASLDRLAK